MQVTAGYIAYGDDNGASTFTTAGYFTLAGMSVTDSAGTGAMALTGIQIDVGSSGAVGAMVITLPSLSGKIAFNSLKLGSAANLGTSLGSLTIGDLTTSASSIIIKAH